MNKRIRKKHHVGEFGERGFVVTFTLDGQVADDRVHAFLDRLADEVLEPRSLQCGGGGDRTWQLFVFRTDGQAASDDDRAAVSGWLAGRTEASEVTVGPLVESRESGAGD
jgi:uncharacterized protein